MEVAGYLGSTPAVARTAYIDPAVFARYQAGRTIASALDELGASTDYGELATRGGAEAAYFGCSGSAREEPAVAACGAGPSGRAVRPAEVGKRWLNAGRTSRISNSRTGPVRVILRL